MDQKTVLITGIGGNVGQGILRNINTLDYDIKTIGVNVSAFSAGNHLVHRFYQIPFYSSPHYITEIGAIVEKEQVDLIIPSTDFESCKLAEYRDKLSCPVATSPYETSCIYLDKYKSYLHHQKYDIPFAPSCLPSAYKGQFERIIVKRREGRGSRDLFFDPKDVSSFSDEFMVQQLFSGKEITTAFYVSKTNKLHGFITLERELVNGTTNECRVVKTYDHQLEQILRKLIAYTPIKGSVNIQSIVCNDGTIVPFEINCRISGTNSIRSNFGFEDVKYTLQEYLYDKEPSLPNVQEGVAIRILMDVIYPGQKDSSKLQDSSANHYLF